MFAVAAWVVSFFSTWGCILATLPNGQFVEFAGLLEGNVTTSSDTIQATYNIGDYKTNTIGLFSFLVKEKNNYYCSGYMEWVDKDNFWKSAMAFSLLRGLFGLAVVIWLFLCTCCPVQPAHKRALFVLSGLAFVCSGFSFLFYGNGVCKEYGCTLTTGAWYQISGSILYLLTTLVILGIEAKEPSWVLQQREEPPHKLQEKAEEGMLHTSNEPPVAVHVAGVVLESK